MGSVLEIIIWAPYSGSLFGIIIADLYWRSLFGILSGDPCWGSAFGILSANLCERSFFEILVWDLNSWEEILQKRVEKRHIVLQELGHVRVSHDLDQDDVLRQVRALTQHLPGHDQDGLDGPESEIVMLILRELL